MKKLLLVLLALTMLIPSMASAKTHLYDQTFQLKTVKTTAAGINVSYPQVINYKDAKAEKSINDQIVTDMKNTITFLQKTQKDTPSITAKVGYKVTCNKFDLMSFVYKTEVKYLEKGQKAGLTVLAGRNFTAKGDKLTSKDFKGIFEVAKATNVFTPEYINKAIATAASQKSLQVKPGFKGISASDDYNYYIDQDTNLCLIFAPGEVGPEKVGPQVLMLDAKLAK